MLVPYTAREAASLREAAKISGMSVETMRRVSSLHDIGRRIGGRVGGVSSASLWLMMARWRPGGAQGVLGRRTARARLVRPLL